MCSALAAHEEFLGVGARRITCLVASIVIRENQVKIVTESFAFGVGALQTTILNAWAIGILAWMSFRAVVPTCNRVISVVRCKIFTIDQLSAFSHG